MSSQEVSSRPPRQAGAVTVGGGERTGRRQRRRVAVCRRRHRWLAGWLVCFMLESEVWGADEVREGRARRVGWSAIAAKGPGKGQAVKHAEQHHDVNQRRGRVDCPPHISHGSPRCCSCPGCKEDLPVLGKPPFERPSVTALHPAPLLATPFRVLAPCREPALNCASRRVIQDSSRSTWSAQTRLRAQGTEWGDPAALHRLTA